MTQRLRCAIYTRKSSEEGLEQDFNSLHAQREACEAYIKSQKHEGWHLIKTAYDDGGISGGTMQRPALQQLLADIAARKVDVIVVYKVDRLTRSLADFARMVELFDSHTVSFVSVTQQFNTTTSMGRLTLNVLLSFAQFEREVTGERIRDKIKASKAKGIFMGGPVPLGYEVKDRKLLIRYDEAQTVRSIFSLYLEMKCVRLLADHLNQARKTNRKGLPFSRGALYTILGNQIYVGKITHRTEVHPGLHEAIIDQDLWDQVQALLIANKKGVQGAQTMSASSPLAGKLFDQAGERLVASHSQKRGRRYRYYVSECLKSGPAKPDGWRLPATEIETLVLKFVRASLIGISLSTLQSLTLSTSEIAHLMERLPEIARTLADVDLMKLVSRVELGAETITLSVGLKPLIPESPAPANELTATWSETLSIKRRGIEMRLVILGLEHQGGPIDPSLVKTIAKAHDGYTDWANDKVGGIRDLAQREGVSKTLVGDRIKLAFLSPKIVEAILTGRHPAGLMSRHLLQAELPLAWSDQEQLFGF